MIKKYCDDCGQETNSLFWVQCKFDINNNIEFNFFEAELCYDCHKQYVKDIMDLGQKWKKPIELTKHAYYED